MTRPRAARNRRRVLRLVVLTAFCLIPSRLPVELRHCPVMLTVDSQGLTDLVQRCRVYVKID